MASGIGIAYVEGPRLRRSLLAAGRLTGWLGAKLNMKPVLCISLEGTVDPVGSARAPGRPAPDPRALAAVLAGRPRSLRLGIAHADVPEFAEALRVELVARYRPTGCPVSPITPVIPAHAGIGAWGVFYQVEDGTNGTPARYE